MCYIAETKFKTIIPQVQFHNWFRLAFLTLTKIFLLINLEEFSGTTEVSEEQKLSSKVPQTTFPAASVFTQQKSSDDSQYCEDSVHHHYFTGAVTLLKDIVLHAEKVMKRQRKLYVLMKEGDHLR